MTSPLRMQLRAGVRAGLINAGLMLGSFVVAVLLGEVAMRALAPQQLIQIRPDVWQPADTVGWLHRPNVSTLINTGGGAVHVHTDAEGFRVGAGGRADDGEEVLILGDSFMEALQVEYEQSFAGRLQKTLPQAAGVPVAVRNAGIDGWGPSHYLLRARQLLARGRYQLVIVALFVGNDAESRRRDYMPPRAPVERHRLRLPARLAAGELVDATLRPINDALEVRSHLFIFLRNRLKTLRMRAGLSPLYFPREFLKSDSTAARWAITADLCREIAHLVARHGASTVFVLIPAAFQVDPDEFARYLRGFSVDIGAVDLDQPSRRLRQELAARRLLVLDALPAFRAHQADGARLYGDVDPHLSSKGHELLAELAVPVAARLIGGAR